MATSGLSNGAAACDSGLVGRQRDEQLTWFRELRKPDGSIDVRVDEEVEALVAFLSSSSASVRRAAADLLGRASDPAVADPLVEHATDEDKNVGNAVASSLSALAARFEDTRALLSENLLHPSSRVRFACVRAWHGSSSELCLLTQDTDESVRWATFRQLAGRAANHRSIDPSLFPPGVSDPSPTVREAALRGLGAVALPNSFDVFVMALADPDPRVRHAAIDGLQGSGEPRTIEVLQPLLNDQQGWVRIHACQAITKIDSHAGIDAAITLLHDRKRWVRRDAARLLGDRQAGRAVEPLVDLLERSGSPAMKATACIALGQIGNKRARPALTTALKDHRPNSHYWSGGTTQPWPRSPKKPSTSSDDESDAPRGGTGTSADGDAAFEPDLGIYRRRNGFLARAEPGVRRLVEGGATPRSRPPQGRTVQHNQRRSTAPESSDDAVSPRMR